MANLSIEVSPTSVPAVLESLKGRWKLTILWYLAQGPLGFNHLKRSIGNISTSVLTLQLTQLHQDELVIKKVYKYREPGVLYCLTPRGEAITPIFTTLKNIL